MAVRHAALARRHSKRPTLLCRHACGRASRIGDRRSRTQRALRPRGGLSSPLATGLSPSRRRRIVPIARIIMPLFPVRRGRVGTVSRSRRAALGNVDELLSSCHWWRAWSAAHRLGVLGFVGRPNSSARTTTVRRPAPTLLIDRAGGEIHHDLGPGVGSFPPFQTRPCAGIGRGALKRHLIHDREPSTTTDRACRPWSRRIIEAGAVLACPIGAPRSFPRARPQRLGRRIAICRARSSWHLASGCLARSDGARLIQCPSGSMRRLAMSCCDLGVRVRRNSSVIHSCSR